MNMRQLIEVYFVVHAMPVCTLQSTLSYLNVRRRCSWAVIIIGRLCEGLRRPRRRLQTRSMAVNQSKGHNASNVDYRQIMHNLI